jgi:hypothetical protein
MNRLKLVRALREVSGLGWLLKQQEMLSFPGPGMPRPPIGDLSRMKPLRVPPPSSLQLFREWKTFGDEVG